MRKIILLPVIAFMVIMMAGLANATLSSSGAWECNLTIATIISENTLFNASFNISDDTAVDNVSLILLARSASTENSSWSVIANISNETQGGGKRFINWTFSDYDTIDGAASSIILRDANDYEWNYHCIQNTSTIVDPGDVELVVGTAVTGRTVDRTKPNCVWASGLVSSDAYAPTQTWSLTCSNMTGTPTLQFGSNTAKSLTISSGSRRLDDMTCSYTGDKSSVPQGSYSSLTATFTDGRNITTCSLNSIRIDIGVPLKEIAAIVASGAQVKGASQPESTDNKRLATVLIILAAGIWLYRRRKKK